MRKPKKKNSELKRIMFLKGVSKVSLGAIGGLLSAVTGAFLGWILFPFMVNLNVNKVNAFSLDFQRFLFILKQMNSNFACNSISKQ